MKTATQLAASALALAGLLAGTASQATNLAELPLKASVLAKPNVIFGMDDSGSMDSELMQYNNDGAFWWNYDTSSGWGTDTLHPNPALRTITATWFNNAGASSSTWRKMVYLFPNGTGTGNRVYNDAANDHFAILPTRQFAFLRWSGVYKDTVTNTYKSAPTSPADSPMHNPIYYNPLVTYQPWAPAQLSSGAVTPTNASSSAAKSHPIYGTTTFDLGTATTVAATPAADTVFTAFPGMRVPNGAKKNVCNSSNGSCAGWVNVTADENAANSKVTRVAMAYYPATYWVREACTVDAGDPVVGTCAYVPGSTTVTLKRYEIKSGNTFPSGRTYAAEMQNFANWFQYYRKRKLMLSAAMGDTMENLTGMRLGVVAFNSNSDVTMYDADATAAANNRLRVAGIFYETDRSGGTPTRETLKYIGEQYKRNSTGAAAANNPVQYACQRNNAFIVTDGFANNSTVTPPGWDAGKSASNWGGVAPYAASFTHDGILADLALRYYTNNLRSDLTAGKLQSTPRDTNPNLHMNTFGLTLGARGTLFLSEDTAAPTTTTAWPDPNTDRNPTSVDDLWRATLAGRGKMYLANTPEETALRIRTGLDEMASLVGGQGGVAVSAVNLSRSDGKAYIGFYNQRGWTGDLEQRNINPADATIATTFNWQAAAQLNATGAWSSRLIFTASGGTGVPFDNASIGATVNPDTTAFPDSNTVVNFLRGSRSGEGDTVRLRSSLLGPVVNAAPVLAPLADQTVYFASGEGMLHAVNTTNGTERWAFVPPEMLVEVGKSVQRGWAYRTLLDGTPVLGKTSTGTRMLVAGLGAAGRAYYALDVSAPKTPTTEALAKAQYKWSFPVSSTDRANMGYTSGKPVFARVNLAGTVTDVVLLTSGYDNGQTIGDGKGRVWMLDAVSGTLLKTFRTADGTAGTAEAGLAHISAFHDADGTVKYAYGGDLLGNLWRFDLTSTDTGEISAAKLAVLKDGSGNTQPVTSAPELVKLSGKRVVLVGTGRMLDIGDFGGTVQRTFYAIADDGTSLSNARTSLTPKTYSRASNPEVSGSAPNWGTGHGWYMDLPAGEEINTSPSVAYGSIVFVTNKNGASDCAQQSYLFYVDMTTGGVPTSSANGSVSVLLSNTATSSEPSVLLDTTGKPNAVGTLSDGTPFKRDLPPGDRIDPTKNAWREIRR